MNFRYTFCALAFIMHQSLYAHYTFIVGQEVTAWVEDNLGAYAEQVDKNIRINDFVIVQDDSFLKQGVNPQERRYYLGQVKRVFEKGFRHPTRYEVSFVASGRTKYCLKGSDVFVVRKLYNARSLVLLPANCKVQCCKLGNHEEQEPAAAVGLFGFLENDTTSYPIEDDGFPALFFDENGEPVALENFLNS